LNFELPLQIIILRIIGLLLVGMVHGLALVALVTAQGDRGPRHDGRLTANPLAHAAPLGLLTAVFTLGGWIRPIDLDPQHLRYGRLGLVGAVVVSLVVPILVFLLLLQFRGLAVASLQPSYSNVVNLALRTFAEMSVVFAVLNLIPLPPLAGGYLLQAAAPRLYAAIRPRTLIVALVLMGLAIFDRGNTVRLLLDPLVRAVVGA